MRKGLIVLALACALAAIAPAGADVMVHERFRFSTQVTFPDGGYSWVYVDALTDSVSGEVISSEGCAYRYDSEPYVNEYGCGTLEVTADAATLMGTLKGTVQGYSGPMGVDMRFSMVGINSDPAYGEVILDPENAGTMQIYAGTYRNGLANGIIMTFAGPTSFERTSAYTSREFLAAGS